MPECLPQCPSASVPQCSSGLLLQVILWLTLENLVNELDEEGAFSPYFHRAYPNPMYERGDPVGMKQHVVHPKTANCGCI